MGEREVEELRRAVDRLSRRVRELEIERARSSVRGVPGSGGGGVPFLDVENFADLGTPAKAALGYVRTGALQGFWVWPTSVAEGGVLR